MIREYDEGPAVINEVQEVESPSYKVTSLFNPVKVFDWFEDVIAYYDVCLEKYDFDIVQVFAHTDSGWVEVNMEELCSETT